MKSGVFLSLDPDCIRATSVSYTHLDVYKRQDEDPQTWLVLAQRLGATDLLARQTLPEPWEASRQARLLEAWHAQGRDELALAWLARQPQTPALSRRRAELLQASGRLQEAERQWLDLYRRTGDLQALDQASFLALQAGRREEALQLSLIHISRPRYHHQ